MRNKLIPAILIIFFTLPFSTIKGQNQINSPYSRFNLGSLQESGPFRSQGMGGVTAAIRDNYSVYFENPASYSSIDTNSFIFDFGIEWGLNKLSDANSDYSSNDMNFNHLVMGFPIAKGLGFAVGVIPYSNGYYSLKEDVTSSDPDYDPVTGEYSTSHTGKGGYYKVFAGAGIRLSKNFSAGINMTYLVGKETRTNLFDFADYYNTFHDKNIEALSLGGLNFEYGLHYTAHLKNEHFFNAGISINPSKKYTATYDKISFRYNAYGSVDTLEYISSKSKSAVIPSTFRTGIAYGKENKFTAGIDFTWTPWSKSTIPGAEGYFGDTKTLLAGIEYIPDRFSNYSVLKRIEYRLGGHIGNDYLVINGEQIKEMGVSAGLGIPVRRSLATRSSMKTNIFFDYCRKSGSLSNNLHTEDIFTVGISINLYDYWFLKRKYD